MCQCAIRDVVFVHWKGEKVRVVVVVRPDGQAAAARKVETQSQLAEDVNKGQEPILLVNARELGIVRIKEYNVLAKHSVGRRRVGARR